MMLSPSPSQLLTRLTATLAAIATVSNAAPKGIRLVSRQNSFNYRDAQVLGVNIGGWLVGEPWIKPSLFERAGDGVVDEYTMGQILGKDAAFDTLSSHWGSWITQDDFNQIAAAGFNHVRIPVGFWAVNDLANGTPYVSGQLEHLDNAISWARSAGLKVVIDLHGGKLRCSKCSMHLWLPGLGLAPNNACAPVLN